MEDKNFVNLIKRYQQGQCTPLESELLNKWLDSLDDGKDRFSVLSEIEKEEIKESLKAVITSKIDQPEKKSIRIGNNIWLRAAALILILLGVYFYQWKTKDTSFTAVLTVQSGTNDIKKLMLPDGSIVWLKGVSKMIYPSKFEATREVSLEGEALFEVVKDAQHPFVIHCGTMTTRVLGTSFNIKRNGNETEVFVLSGSVTLSSTKSAHNILLKSNDKVIYTEATNMFEMQPGITVLQDRISHISKTGYDMNFDDALMENVLKRIEQKFEVKIIIDNPELNKCLFTADLTDQSMASALRIMTQTFGGNFRINGSEVQLNGLKCR